MPYVHRLRRLICGRYASASFYVRRKRAGRCPRHAPLPPTRQPLVQLPRGPSGRPALRPAWTPADEVLVRKYLVPSPADGCGQTHLIRCLKRLGVVAEYRDRLGPRTLHRLAARTPVIVTVWPEWYACDHWTVVRGLDRAGRVFSDQLRLAEQGRRCIEWKESGNMAAARCGSNLRAGTHVVMPQTNGTSE